MKLVLILLRQTKLEDGGPYIQDYEQNGKSICKWHIWYNYAIVVTIWGKKMLAHISGRTSLQHC